MKKIITILTLTATLAGSSAFGQGYFKFASSKSIVWNGGGSASALSTKMEVALLWAAASTASPFAGGAIGLNAVPIAYNSSSVTTFSASQAAAALAGSSFTFATAATTPSAGAPIIGFASATGVVSFNSGATFDITGGPGASQTYTLMLVTWDRQYASFAAAAAAVEPSGNSGTIGWSAPIQLASGLALNDATISSAPFTQFGSFATPTPEPGTMAIAALGGASLLLFRRKK